MAKEDIIQEFNEGGVKGVMAAPTENAMSKLLDGIPKKTTTTTEVKVEAPVVDLGDDGKSKAPIDNTEPKGADGSETIIATSATDVDDEPVVSTTEPKKEEKKEEKVELAGDSIIAEFSAEFGEVEGQTFEEDTDGLKEYFKAVIPTIRIEAKKEAVDELFQEAPILGELANHLAKGYGFDSFRQKFEAYDYTKLEIKEDDTKLQENLYRAALKAKGNTDEDIEDLVTTAKDTGKLLDKSKASVTYLDTQQKVQIDSIQKQEKAQKDAEIKEQQDTLAEVEKILKTGKVAGLQIAADRIKSLKDASSTMTTKGVSQLDEKWNNLSLEQRVLLDIIVNNDFKDLGVKPSPASTQSKKLIDIKKKAEASPKVDLNSSRNGNVVEGIKGSNIREYLQS